MSLLASSNRAQSYEQRSSTLLVVACEAMDPCRPRPFLSSPSLETNASSSSCQRSEPLQSSFASLTFPTCRPDPPCLRFRLPLTAPTGLAPYCGGLFPDPPRIRSQAFSTSQRFLQSQSSWPCFMPQPFAGYPPSESSPRRDRGVLSDPPAASVIHPRALCTTPDVFTLDFTDAHAFDAVAWIPTSAEEAHSPRPKSLIPDTRRLEQRNHSVPQASPASQRYSLSESVRVTRGFPRPTADTLLVVRPL